jgi:hypothetical protein
MSVQASITLGHRRHHVIVRVVGVYRLEHHHQMVWLQPEQNKPLLLKEECDLVKNHRLYHRHRYQQVWVRYYHCLYRRRH